MPVALITRLKKQVDEYAYWVRIYCLTKLKEMTEKGLKTRCTKLHGTLRVGASHDINSVNLSFEVRAVRKITCEDTDAALQVPQSRRSSERSSTNTETAYIITLTVPLTVVTGLRSFSKSQDNYGSREAR